MNNYERIIFWHISKQMFEWNFTFVSLISQQAQGLTPTGNQKTHWIEFLCLVQTENKTLQIIIFSFSSWTVAFLRSVSVFFCKYFFADGLGSPVFLTSLYLSISLSHSFSFSLSFSFSYLFKLPPPPLICLFSLRSASARQV